MKGVACCTLTSVTATLIQYPSQRPHFLSQAAVDLHALGARAWIMASLEILSPRPPDEIFGRAPLAGWLAGGTWAVRYGGQLDVIAAECMALEPLGRIIFHFFYAFHKADLCAIDFLIYSWPSGRSLAGSFARCWCCSGSASKWVAVTIKSQLRERRCALQMDFFAEVRCNKW